MQSDLICICWKILIPVLTVWYFKTTFLLKRCAELIMFCKVCMYYVADPSFELIMFYEVWMYYIFSFFCFFVCTIHSRQSTYYFALSKPNWSENQKCIVCFGSLEKVGWCTLNQPHPTSLLAIPSQVWTNFDEISRNSFLDFHEQIRLPQHILAKSVKIWRDKNIYFLISLFWSPKLCKV